MPVDTFFELKGGMLKVDHKCDPDEQVHVDFESSGDDHQNVHQEPQPAAAGGHVVVPISD